MNLNTSNDNKKSIIKSTSIFFKIANNNIYDRMNDNQIIKFIRLSRNEYLYGTNSKKLSTKQYFQKMRMARDIIVLIEKANIIYKSPLIHPNKSFPIGFNNYQGSLKIDNNFFRYIVRIGISKQNQSIFYDLSLIEIKKQKGIDHTVL